MHVVIELVAHHVEGNEEREKRDQGLLQCPGQGPRRCVELALAAARRSEGPIANKCLRPATSNDSWGPTGTQMSEIAQLTYNAYVYTHPCYRDWF